MIKTQNGNTIINVVNQDDNPINFIRNQNGDLIWSRKTIKADFVDVREDFSGMTTFSPPSISVVYTPSSGFAGTSCTAKITVTGQYGVGNSGTNNNVYIKLEGPTGNTINYFNGQASVVGNGQHPFTFTETVTSTIGTQDTYTLWVDFNSD